MEGEPQMEAWTAGAAQYVRLPEGEPLAVEPGLTLSLGGMEAMVVADPGARAFVARTTRALRLLETDSPPTFYLPVDDVEIGMLTRAPGHSRCEWKGEASYWDVGPAEDQVARAAWSYEQPFADYSVLAGHLSFYPALLLCTVAGEAVRPQPGGFYGGWVTDDVVGPFKGEPGTGAW